MLGLELGLGLRLGLVLSFNCWTSDSLLLF